ncbi:FecR family protein [Adhaeribacter radiodurans]|uniref:FecR domain-containing protein n=1 Tax=Adhaeribacter radiodurans TaxID=2745197 RepID=A0A7L7LD04_9BACT|nr:FecR domain-containing protein [Adhaeribacter radiodurans]QMU30718.1 FecR domain-containing protein [Adhaeribacter radiodurans]
MKFSDYELKDFIQDESFQNWVNKTVPDDVIQWEQWLENNMDKLPLANEAATIIRGINFNRQQVPRHKIDASWQKLTRHIAQTESTPLGATRVKWHQRREVWQFAAVWLGFLVVTAVGFYFHQQTKELRYQTGFGETTTIILPDKSTVVLNSNSKLVLRGKWSSQKDREVWLDGEAFFSVVKKTGRGDARFLVHTGNMDVKVLGTKFNVNSRKSRTRVVLNSGKVQLKAGKLAPGKTTIMHPGELVELTSDKKEFVKKKVNPLVYSSWIHKKLLFDDTSIQDIAGLLQDNYGFQVKIADSTLIDRKLTGEVYVEDVETLLTALSKSFQLEMIQKGNTLIIKGK